MRATFQPQAWINDNAVEVDAEGETSWTVSGGFAVNVTIRDGIDINDVLKGDPAAPEWVRTWRGPFTIFVEDDDFVERAESRSKAAMNRSCQACGFSIDEYAEGETLCGACSDEARTRPDFADAIEKFLTEPTDVEAAEAELRAAVEAKEQAMAGLTADSDSHAEVALYDEAKADANEAIAEAAANLVDAWAAESAEGDFVDEQLESEQEDLRP